MTQKGAKRMAKFSLSDKISEQIQLDDSISRIDVYETSTWISSESREHIIRNNSSLDVVTGFLSVYDSSLRFSLESTLAAFSMILNGYILVSTCKYSRNMFHLRRPSLYTLLFIHLTLVNFVSTPLTWTSNNLLLAGRKWAWFPISVRRLNFCQFTGALVSVAVVSMVINLAATFIILGFSLVQCIAISCPLRQLSLLRRRNVRCYLIVCWLGVLVGCLVPLGFILKILESLPPAPDRINAPRNFTGTNATSPIRSPSLCHEIQFLNIVQLLTHFSYFATFLITVMYISAFSLCVATFLKIKKVGKKMVNFRNRPRDASRGGAKSQTTMISEKSGTECDALEMKRIGRSCLRSERRKKILIFGRENSDVEKKTNRSYAGDPRFEAQETQLLSPKSNHGPTDKSAGPTNADRRAFVTIAALGGTLTFYLVPSLVIQFLTNSPLEESIIANPFLIYFMALLPYTKFLVDPIIYGLRMPEMKSSIFCVCGSRMMNYFGPSRTSRRRGNDSKSCRSVDPSKWNTRSKDFFSNSDVVMVAENNFARRLNTGEEEGSKSAGVEWEEEKGGKVDRTTEVLLHDVRLSIKTNI